MKKLILLLFIPLVNSAQIIPDNSDYNQNIIWESVFTTLFIFGEMMEK